MYKLDINEIRDRVRKYKLKQILISGENDMFDDKIDRKKIEEVLNQGEKIDDKKTETETIEALDLKRIINETDNLKIYDSIINLKKVIDNVE